MWVIMHLGIISTAVESILITVHIVFIYLKRKAICLRFYDSSVKQKSGL